jgi:molybdopterin/thiamine biosynthesis adenylyltransferase
MPARQNAKSRTANRITKIKVVGLGGIGLCLLPTLCRFLNYGDLPRVEVHLIDGDEFEERNRDRQDFTVPGPKACVIADEYRQRFPRLVFWDHPEYLADDNIISLIREHDLVFV